MKKLEALLQRDRFWQWFPWALLILFILPQWIFGQDTVLPIHDMLDSELPQRVLLAKSGHIWTRDPFAIVPSIMGGVPRGTLPSAYRLDNVLYGWLPPYWAWSVYETLTRAIALAGALRLARVWLGGAPVQSRDETIRQAAVAAAAIGFALSPWLSVCGLYVAGQPWLAWSWMRLYENRRDVLAWIVWPIFAFWSSFAILGPPLVISLGIWWLIRAWKDRALAWAPIAAIILYVSAVVIAELPLFQLTASGFDHNRYTWDAVALAKPFAGALQMALKFLWIGQPHAPTYPFVGWILFAATLVGVSRKDSDSRARLHNVAPAFLVLLAIALLHLLWQWRTLAAFRQPIPTLRFVQFDRFYLLGPLPWLFILVRLGASFSHRAVKVLLCTSPLLWFILSPTWSGIYKKAAHHAGLIAKPPITYRQYASADLFAEMQAAVHPTRVGSLGMHPAVAQLNGLWTVDGYLQMYARTYKERFRRVIEAGLARPNGQDFYMTFDAWGSQAYLSHPKPPIPHNIQDLNTEALCALGADHVLTNGPVQSEQAAKAGWELRFQGTHPNAAWNLHAYRLPCKH